MKRLLARCPVTVPLDQHPPSPMPKEQHNCTSELPSNLGQTARIVALHDQLGRYGSEFNGLTP